MRFRSAVPNGCQPFCQIGRLVAYSDGVSYGFAFTPRSFKYLLPFNGPDPYRQREIDYKVCDDSLRDPRPGCFPSLIIIDTKCDGGNCDGTVAENQVDI